MRKTKIICTLGPACEEREILEEMILLGMNAARLNFSHGTHEEHSKRVALLKELRDKHQLPIPLILDTKGPEIRTGRFEGPTQLMAGQDFTITIDDCIGDVNRMTVSYKDLYKDVNVGQSILIDDGLIELKVKRINAKGDILCTVVNGGLINSTKGVNLPGAHVNLPALSEKDREDLLFGIANDFDFVAQSFVRRGADVLEARKFLDKNGGKDIKIIAKIENQQGVDNCEEIIRVADAIMIARGDLGVEIPVEEVPPVQKKLIVQSYTREKPVITATQMLDSMIRNPRPTRAEANDVANTIFDGTSCVMLSGETAAGQYPLEALATMARIVEAAERNIDYWREFTHTSFTVAKTIGNAISHSTCSTAMHINAKAIASITHSGDTARRVARFRPACPIVAVTPSPKACRQLNLSWGIYPYVQQEKPSTDALFADTADTVESTGFAAPGDLIVITAGVPVGFSGTTNLLKVQMVGHMLVGGKCAAPGVVTGELCVAANTQDALVRFSPGQILVVPCMDEALLPILRHAKGLISESEDQMGSAATVGLTLDIPVLVGAAAATSQLKSGTVIQLDATHGMVKRQEAVH